MLEVLFNSTAPALEKSPEDAKLEAYHFET